MSSGASVIAILVRVLAVMLSVKVLNEYERGVIFRLGKLLPEAQGAGARSSWPCPSTAWCASACAPWSWTCRPRTSSPATT